MPRKFDDTKKKEWLRLYEAGKTEKWIAHQVKCDLRTVRKAINDARLKRDVLVARMELVKDALRKHQDSLLEELDQIMSSLVIPPKDIAVLSWYRGGNSVFNESDDQTKPEAGRNSSESVSVDSPGFIHKLKQSGSIPRIQDSALRRLLKEHLKNDKLWRVLGQWEKAKESHLAARAALQRKTAALLQDKTTYKLVDNGGSPPFVYSYTAGPLFYDTAINIAFATPEEMDMEEAISSLETAMSINTDNGDIKFRNSIILAVAPGREQETKRNLLDALRLLIESPEIEPVAKTYQALEQITERTRQVVEGIRLLGLIPGQCEICRRLGM